MDKNNTGPQFAPDSKNWQGPPSAPHASKQHDSCTQLRRYLVTHSKLNLATGERSDERTEWVVKPCGVPLFGYAERVRGTCGSCNTGWTHEHNYAVTPDCVACAMHYGDLRGCDEGKPVASPHRKVEARRDDEHGFEHPWAAFIDGKILRGTRAVRTFKTQNAAMVAANAVLKSGAVLLQSSAKGAE